MPGRNGNFVEGKKETLNVDASASFKLRDNIVLTFEGLNLSDEANHQWVGGDDRSIHFRDFNRGQGSRMAMPIWSYYMDKVYATPGTGVKKGPFERPKNLSITLDCNQWQRAAVDSTVESQTLQDKEEDFNQ